MKKRHNLFILIFLALLPSISLKAYMSNSKMQSSAFNYKYTNGSFKSVDLIGLDKKALFNDYAGKLFRITNDSISNKMLSNIFGNIGINLLHIIPTNYANELSWITPPLNFGGEILIGNKLDKHFKIYSGLNYQYGKIFLQHIYYGDRTFFHEISIPVLGAFSFKPIGSEFSFKTGIYVGKYINITRQRKGGKITSDSNNWTSYPIKSNSQIFICDYYFGVQKKLSPFKNTFNIEVFFKYRLNNTWLNTYISNFSYGIKFTKLINIKL